MLKKIVRPKVEAFLKQHASNVRVLDVGASSVRYRELFPNKISLDLFAENHPDVVGDAHALPFADEAFPMVMCVEVLEHVLDPRQVARELSRVLAPGGKLILTTRFMYPLHEAPHDNWRFTEFVLRDIFAGFDDVTVTPDTLMFETLTELIQRAIFQTRFHFMDKPIKGVLVIIGWIVRQFDRFSYTTYGNINKTMLQPNIFTAGYLVTAYKKKR
jgi:SAM-dependent methyltransferase